MPFIIMGIDVSGAQLFGLGFCTAAAIASMLVWKQESGKRQKNREYIRSRILNALRGPDGPVTRNYSAIRDACVTDHVSEKEVREELEWLVDEGRVDRHDLSDYNFVYSIPGTIKLRHVPLPPGSVV
jgi:hypothetical protein